MSRYTKQRRRNGRREAYDSSSGTWVPVSYLSGSDYSSASSAPMSSDSGSFSGSFDSGGSSGGGTD